jgi:tetratricopeptide (TPR) repeat protein
VNTKPPSRQSHRMRRFRASFRAALPAALLLLVSCATPGPEPVSISDSAATPQTDGSQVEPDQAAAFANLPNAPAIDQLRTRASEQVDAINPSLESPPAWLPESLHIPGDQLAEASAPLEAALEPIRLEPLFTDPPDAAPEPSAENRDQALRLYARGRLARADAEPAQALSAFESAARLDPGSPQVWRALGNAQMASGLRSSGIRSLQRAAQLGLDDVRIWALIGLEAVRRRDADNGIRWLVAARDGLRAGADPVAVSWIEVSLGELLLNRQRLRAGATLIRSALTRPITDSSRSSFQSEYATLVRRRPQLWVRVGDAQALIGDWRGAADAYDSAAEESSEDFARTIALRHIGVLLASGRTAEASLTLLERIARNAGTVTDDDLHTLKQLGESEPDLSQAIGELAQTLATTPGTRSRLLLAQLSAASTLVDLNTLAPGIELRPEHVIELLRLIPDDAGRWSRGEQLVERNPADAGPIAEALFAGGLLGGPALVERSAGRDLLSLRVRLRMGLVNRSLDLEPASASVEETIALLESATRIGNWDAARRLVGPLESQGGLTAARGLYAAMMPGRAFAVWREAMNISNDPSELLFGAQLALEADELEQAGKLLVRAHEIDPFEYRVYGLIMRVLGNPAENPSRPELESAMRTMRTNASWTVAYESLEIAQVLGRGFTAEAEARARNLLERIPTPTASDFQLILKLWQEAAQRGDDATLEKAERWLRDGLDPERPTQARATVLSQVIALRSDPLAGEAFLSSLPLAPTPDLIEARASLLARGDRREDARSLLHTLYDHDTLSLRDTLRLARINLETDQTIAPTLERLAGIPPEIELSPRDLPVFTDLANALMSIMLGKGTQIGTDSPLGLEFASLVSFALDHGASLPGSYHRVRLRALAQSPGTPLADLISATAQMHADLGEVNDGAFEDIFTLLVREERTQDALRWAVTTLTLEAQLDESRWNAMVGPIASLGTVATIESLIDQLDGHGLLESAVAALLPEDPDETRTDTDKHAEMAYLFAGIAVARDLNLQAIDLYKLALRYQPDHPWACNDYGYLLANRNENLAEADRLLEIAIKALPDQANVLDSIGWLRYKQGRFTEPDGTGALEYLTRAIATPEGAASATMNDHLGDTLWMVGQDEAAQDAWERAEAFYLQRVRGFNSPDLRRLPVYAQQQALLGAVREKLRSLEIEDMDPPVAKTLGTRIETDR